MFHSLRAPKFVTTQYLTALPRFLLGGSVAITLAVTMWFALITVTPHEEIVLAAPNDAITGLTAENSGPALVNTTVDFTASVSAGTGITYTWDFGDGGVSTNITASHTYTLSGVYTATVVAVNSTDTETATTTVYVGDALVNVEDNFYDPTPVTVTVGSNVLWVYSGVNQHSVTADDDSFDQPPTTPNWSTFSQTFDSAGTVPYHCSIHGADGGVGMAGTIVVEAEPVEPIGGLSASNDSPAKVNTPIAFTATITAGSEVSYTWDFGDGNTGEDIVTSHSYTEPGIYTATVEATNISGTATATTTAYVGDEVVEVDSDFYDPTPATIPSGGTVVWVLRGGFHSVTADDLSFDQPEGSDWSPFVHTFPPLTTTVAALNAVDYTYHCTVHPTTMTGTVTVAALSTPITGLSATSDSPALVNTPVAFTATVTAGDEISYTWDFGDGATGVGETATHSYAASGEYSATVFAVNATDSQSDTTTVVVADALVEVKDNFYDPTPVTIGVGETVLWVYSGANQHSVTADDDSSFDQPPTTPNWSTFSQTFDSAGTVPYHCSIHGADGGVGMAGTVIVEAEQSNIRMPQIGKNPLP